VFGPFNRFFKASSDRYQGSVSRILGAEVWFSQSMPCSWRALL